MLLSQHKNIRKISALLQLVGVSATIHFLVGLLLFYVVAYDVAISRMHVVSKQMAKEVPIIVVGYTKKQQVPEKKVSTGIRTGIKQATRTVSSSKKIAAPAKIEKKAVSKKNEPAKKVAEKTQASVSEQRAKRQAVPEQLLTPKKDLIEKKQDVQKLPQSEPVVQKIEKVIEKVSGVHEQASNVPVHGQELSAVPNGPVIVAHNYREKIALTKQYAFEKALSEVWSPPVGMQGHTCTMKIYTAHDGSIAKIDLVKSSGLLMYDVQARSAIMRADIPIDVRGTVIEITFEC